MIIFGHYKRLWAEKIVKICYSIDVSRIFQTKNEPAFSKLFERHKNVYYCQEFTIYHVIGLVGLVVRALDSEI